MAKARRRLARLVLFLAVALPLAVAALANASVANAATTISGGNVVNSTWTLAGNPYNVTGDVLVPVGSTLTIEPGVQVLAATTDDQAAGSYPTKVELNVAGVLDARGTGSSPITFSSVGSSPGSWGGMVLGGAVPSTLDRVIVERATNGIAVVGGTPIPPGNAVITNSRVRQNSMTGIDVLTTGTVTLSGNTIDGNQVGVYLRNPNGGFPPQPLGTVSLVSNTIRENQAGILTDIDSPPASLTVSQNNLVQNSAFNWLHDAPFDVAASNNWWGSVDPPVINQSIHEQGVGDVLYEPPLVAPSATAPPIILPVVPSITPQVTTEAPIGAEILGQAILENGFAAAGTITFRAYGPDDVGCSNPSAYTSDPISVSGDEKYETDPPFTPAARGTYRWRASYSGDWNNSPVTTACSDPDGTSTIVQATPSLANQATATATLGQAISDQATLAGGHVPTGTVTFRAYGPGDSGCANPAAYVSDPVTVSGNAGYGSAPAFTPPAVGAYRWRASYSGDGDNAAVTTPCNAGNALSTVTAAITPPIVTPPSTTPGETTTGQRAAALKKCKRKKKPAARKKCKKKAGRLPV